MRITGDFHTHTIYSRNNHGKSTIEENVIAAINLGLKDIGISDHGLSHLFYGLKREKLKDIRKEIDELNKKYPEINIYFGVEANLLDFDGNIDVKDADLKYFDYIACGYHYGIKPNNLKTAWRFYYQTKFKNFSKKTYKDLENATTNSLIKASYKNDIKFITHPGEHFPVDAKKLAREVNPSTALEINTSHGYLRKEDLIKIKNLKTKLIINTDAHCAKNVGRFGNALEMIEEVGIDKNRIINLGE